MESIKDVLFRQRIENSFNEKLLEKDKRIEDLEKRVNLINKPVNESRKNALSTKQKVLILHYLGLIDSIDLITQKKAKILSVLLERSEQDIKSGITYVNARKIEKNDIKTKNNIHTVKKLFEELRISNYNEKIDRDLEKLEKL